MLRRIAPSLAVGMVVLAGLASAEPAEWRFDGAHSYVGFKVRHLMVSWVRGRFAEAQGKVWYDPADPAATRMEISINPASVNTENKARDNDLRGEEFFEVDKYPEMKFVSKRAAKDGDKLQVTGDLTMHGITKEVVLEVSDISPAVPDGRGGQKMGATAAAKINRKDWDIKYNKMVDTGGFVAADEVIIEIEAELARGGAAQKKAGS